MTALEELRLALANLESAHDDQGHDLRRVRELVDHIAPRPPEPPRLRLMTAISNYFKTRH